MSRVLLITDLPTTRTRVGLALNLMGVFVHTAGSLTVAAAELSRGRFDAAILDLRWSVLTAPAMASWVHRHLVPADMTVVLCADTPLAQDLNVAVTLPSAVFLSRNYDLADLAEALGAPVCARKVG